MNKTFKVVAAVIIAFGVLLYVRERKLVNHQKDMSQVYLEEKDHAQKSLEDIFVKNSSTLSKKDSGISSCLGKVKSVTLETIKEEADMIIASLKAMGNAAKDSSERMTAGDKYVLAKLNKQNTLFVYFDKLENHQFSLQDELRKLVYEHSSYSSKIGTYTNLQVPDRENSLNKAINLKYIVVVQPEKIKHGELIKANEFNPGYLILDYEVYNIETKEKMRASSLLATNSESLSIHTMRNSDLDFFLYNDLLRQGKKAMDKTIFGTNND
jgi:hypothetical protein